MDWTIVVGFIGGAVLGFWVGTEWATRRAEEWIEEHVQSDHSSSGPRTVAEKLRGLGADPDTIAHAERHGKCYLQDADPPCRYHR